MEMNIKLDLSIGEGESKKDISLTYDEAKELYVKLGETLFKEVKHIDLNDWFKDLDKYKKVWDQDRWWPRISWTCYSTNQ